MQGDSEEPEGDWRPEPLTHRNSAGEVYQRHPVVEQQIIMAMRLGPDGLRARAALADTTSPDFLREESLVYLIRHFHRAGQQQLVNDLAEVLLRRCATFIHRRLRSLGDEAARTGYEDVVERLLSLILDLGSDRGDFLQVRFWLGLERLVLRVYHELLLELRRMQATVPISSLAGYDHDEEDEAGQTVRRGRQVGAEEPPDEWIASCDLVRDALRCIEEPFRSAFLLRYYMGWPVEDQDPSVRTISRHFGKDPRTIRNWLRKAGEALQRWRGEQQ